MTAEKLAKGDYVLATKYSDGDPLDGYAIGFYDREQRDRHYVVDNDGNQFRGNGFRRVAKISHERGVWLVGHIPEIDKAARSVWWWKRAKMSVEH